jgi:hypothetical protein
MEIPVDSKAIQVRVFMNGQLMTTCKIVQATWNPEKSTFTVDADLEIFEMEKK